MTDQIATKSSSRKYLLPLLVGVSALALVGFLASRSGLDKELLRQQMEAFAKSLHERGEKQGRDVTLTYGEIAIDGSFSRKHGVIHDVKLTIKPLKPDTDADSLVIATPVAEIYPKSVDLSAIQIQLPQPVDFTSEAAPEKKLLTVKANAPLTLDVAQTEENKVNYLDMRHPVPTQLELTYLREHQAEGTEDATPNVVPVYKKLTMTTAEGGVIQTHFSADGKGLGQGKIDVHALQLAPEGVANGEIKIAEIVSNWSNALNEKNSRVSSLKLHIGDITAAPEFLPYAPIALTVDGAYEGAASQTPEDVAAIGAQQSAIKLTQFALTTKDAKLTAVADFASGAGDILPEGTANVTLTNVPYVLTELRDNGVLKPTTEALVTPVLEMTTGQKLAEIKDASIDVKRARGGAFAIGKSTFEELFAVILKGALTQAHGGGAPALPAAKKPAEATPDAVKKAPEKTTVEEGARG